MSWKHNIKWRHRESLLLKEEQGENYIRDIHTQPVNELGLHIWAVAKQRNDPKVLEAVSIALENGIHDDCDEDLDIDKFILAALDMSDES